MISRIIPGLFAIYGKPRTNLQLQNQGACDLRFTHYDSALSKSELAVLAPHFNIQSTAAAFTVENQRPEQGAWHIGPFEDWICFTSLSPQGISLDGTICSDELCSSSRLEFCEQISLLVNKSDWEHFAPQLLGQMITWICSTRRQLGINPEMRPVQPKFVVNDTQCVNPDHNQEADLIVNAVSNGGRWCSGTSDSLDDAFAVFTTILSKMSGSTRTSTTFSVGYLRQLIGNDIQFFTGRNLELANLSALESARLRAELSIIFQQNRSNEPVLDLLNHILKTKRLPSDYINIAKYIADTEFNCFPATIEDLTAILEIHDLLLTAIVGTPFELQVTKTVRSLLARVLKRWHFLPTSFWKKMAELHVIPGIIGSTFDSSDSSTRLRLDMALHMARLESREFDGIASFDRHFRARLNWRGTQWPLRVKNRSFEFSFTRAIQECVEEGNPSFFSLPQLLNAVSLDQKGSVNNLINPPSKVLQFTKVSR